MINMNNLMKTVLEGEEVKTGNLQINAILNEIVNKTKMVKECIIYDDDGTLEEEKIDFSKILKFVGDWTNYEVSCNELRFGREEIFPGQFLILANQLSHMLSQKYDERKIVVYILLYDDAIELRFHTYRERERLWLDEDLNQYDVPILCWI